MTLDFPSKLSVYPVRSNQDQFPYRVSHDISPYSSQWSECVNWCKKNIGEQDGKWQWFISSVFCFKNQSDATLFCLTWGSSSNSDLE